MSHTYLYALYVPLITHTHTHTHIYNIYIYIYIYIYIKESPRRDYYFLKDKMN